MSIREGLIRRLGGRTEKEYQALRRAFDRTAEAMLEQGKAVIMEGRGPLTNPHIDGTLIVAPLSGAVIMGAYCEGRASLPVDEERNVL